MAKKTENQGFVVVLGGSGAYHSATGKRGPATPRETDLPLFACNARCPAVAHDKRPAASPSSHRLLACPAAFPPACEALAVSIMIAGACSIQAWDRLLQRPTVWSAALSQLSSRLTRFCLHFSVAHPRDDPCRPLYVMTISVAKRRCC
jgi:hypothetical protein